MLLIPFPFLPIVALALTRGGPSAVELCTPFVAVLLVLVLTVPCFLVARAAAGLAHLLRGVSPERTQPCLIPPAVWAPGVPAGKLWTCGLPGFRPPDITQT